MSDNFQAECPHCERLGFADEDEFFITSACANGNSSRRACRMKQHESSATKPDY